MVKQGVICYFSGTGNTKLACEYIQKHLTGVNVDLFDITRDETPDFANYDFAGFATLTDFYDPPYIMQQFVEKLPHQNNKPAFLFNTCGAISGKTLRTLHQWVAGKGFKVVASFTLSAPGSYPPLVARGLRSPDHPSTKSLSAFKDFINKLNSLLAAGSDLPEVQPKIGLVNAIWPRFARTSSKKYMGNKYVDKDLCTKCGQCERGCPYKAVKIDGGPVFDESRCYGCWVCFNNCPKKAIYTKKIRGKGHSPLLQAYRDKLS